MKYNAVIRTSGDRTEVSVKYFKCSEEASNYARTCRSSYYGLNKNVTEIYDEDYESFIAQVADCTGDVAPRKNDSLWAVTRDEAINFVLNAIENYSELERNPCKKASVYKKAAQMVREVLGK